MDALEEVLNTENAGEKKELWARIHRSVKKLTQKNLRPEIIRPAKCTQPKEGSNHGETTQG
jgi:hypothetical protein